MENLPLDSSHPKTRFYQHQIADIKDLIIKQLEGEIQTLNLKKLEELEELLMTMKDIEKQLPKENDFIENILDVDLKNIEGRIPIFDSQNASFTGPKEDINYLNAFPLKAYSTVLNEYCFFFIDNNQDIIKKIIVSGKPFEPEYTKLFKKYVIPGSTVIDVGAHIGIHTLSLSLFAGKNGKVYSFEPQKKIFREQVMNLMLNHQQNVIAFNCALGNKNGWGELEEAKITNEGMVSFGYGGDNCYVIPLDRLHLDHVSLIKMDVENYELEVLQGATETIKKNQPVILIEIMKNITPDRAQKMIQVLNY